MSYSEPTNYNNHFDISVSPFVSADSDMLGRISVDSDGGPTQGRSVTLANGAYIKALGGNAGNVYVSFDSAGDSDTGFEIGASDPPVRFQVQNLNYVWIKGAAGDGVCWLKA